MIILKEGYIDTERYDIYPSLSEEKIGPMVCFTLC